MLSITLPLNKTFYWKVRCYIPGTSLYGPWSSTWLFTTRAFPLGIANVSDEILVYPIPANNFLYTKGSFDLETISCYDELGREVSIAHSGNKIDIRNLENGVYYLNISRADKKKKVVRFIKK